MNLPSCHVNVATLWPHGTYDPRTHDVGVETSQFGLPAPMLWVKYGSGTWYGIRYILGWQVRTSWVSSPLVVELNPNTAGSGTGPVSMPTRSLVYLFFTSSPAATLCIPAEKEKSTFHRYQSGTELGSRFHLLRFCTACTVAVSNNWWCLTRCTRLPLSSSKFGIIIRPLPQHD